MAACGVAQRSSSIPPLPSSVRGKPKAETMFFIHGWPDNSNVFSAQVEFFESEYRCVTVDLPHFGRPSTLYSRWGYDLEELADMCAAALRKSLQSVAQDSAILVLHDWGSVIGMNLQRKYPGLVSKMVIIDVALSNPQGFSLKGVPGLVFLGVVYQYWLALAWFVSLILPWIGHLLGTWMTYIMVYNMQAPVTSHRERAQKLTALMNYPYFWFQFRSLQEALGIRAGFDKRHGIGVLEQVPTLFLYGADKGYNFHSKVWEKQLQSYEDCHVVAVDAHMNQGRHVGHWVQVEAAEIVNFEVSKWLHNVDDKYLQRRLRLSSFMSPLSRREEIDKIITERRKKREQDAARS
eukprot:gnl/MRDRNA2_/MRDRNA2_24836_c0_seq1.p1 gnl/MRDRNA2_/MRDRNA2_24836_c0~~gnl/MRDRNA2_/MRDRNA2_24836_c0_seq1.p1  ORF type:complete len:405 (+),score=65.94 gnl/MRDRNA2_/MRDRNA2_24836_c0_seq1:169-1215(+)